MADSANSPASVPGSASSGGAADFVDFYQILGVSTEATTTALRRRINELYSEAQSNRDHRNAGKRRHYQALCDLLPYCRIVLLEPDKRARYDRYREQAKVGAPIPDFENIMDEIAGSVGEEKHDNGQKSSSPTARSDDQFLLNSSTTDTATEGAAPASRRRLVSEVFDTINSGDSEVETTTSDDISPAADVGHQKRGSQPANASVIASVLSVVVFAVVSVLAYFVFFRGNLFMTLLTGAIAAGITWIVAARILTQRNSGDRISF